MELKAFCFYRVLQLTLSCVTRTTMRMIATSLVRGIFTCMTSLLRHSMMSRLVTMRLLWTPVGVTLELMRK